MFLRHFLCVFVTFHFKMAKEYTFPFEPFTSHLADNMSPITLTKIYVVFNKPDTCYVCILGGMQEENITNRILFCCLEPKKEKRILSILLKKYPLI